MQTNERLITSRTKLNLTHDEVSRRANISRSYYTNIELGRKTPSMKVAKQIADVLNTTVDKIFFDDDVPKRNAMNVIHVAEVMIS